MKKNKILAYLLLCVATCLFTFCTDRFLEFNTDSNGATAEELIRDGYITNSMLISMGNYVVATDVNLNQFVECLMGGSFGGYLADSNDGFNGRNYSTYGPEEHWIQVAFNDIIPAIFVRNNELRELLKDDPILLSVASVLKVAALARVTDIYGPIPYSQVGVGGELEAPYDSQEQVYNQMFAELDEAIEVFTTNQSVVFNPSADNVYNGVVSNWLKFANSMKLRLAMRIVNADPALAQQKAEEAVNHVVGPMSSNADNAMKQAAGKNPFRVVMYDYNDGDSRISADILSYMNGYGDPRREKYFTESTFSGGGYIGLRSGVNIPADDAIKTYSNMRVEDDTKLLWMNAAEVAFLKAEGVLRGWNMGGGAAEDFYNEGITLSFEQWGANGASAYIDDAVSRPAGHIDPIIPAFNYSGALSMVTPKWDTAGAFEANLEQIITQKWIAMFPLGVEAWSEYRRTGYPKLMEVQLNRSGGKVNSSRMARRLPYPMEEYTENNDNLQHAITNYLNGADDMGTDVWWAR